MTRPRQMLFSQIIRSLSLVAISATLLAAQGGSGSRLATRAQLETTAQTLERAVASPAYGERIRQQATRDLAQVRRRLQEGDFRVGERIFMSVDGGEMPWADTVTVRDSLLVDIPGVKRIRLYGVLRSELEQHVFSEVATVIRTPLVTVRPLLRVAVLGAVTTPGFRAVPSETLVDQLLSLGGSPLPVATLDKMRIMRADTVLMEGPQVLGAIAEGRTLASLDVVDGDALFIPQGSPPWDRTSTLQIVSLVLGPIIAVLVTR